MQKKILSLEQENQHLKNKLNLLGAGIQESLFSVPEKLNNLPRSISGLEGMYIQIDKNDLVINLNRKMADLINEEKNNLLQTSISLHDDIPWAKKIFQTLINDCRNRGEEIEWETEYLDTASGDYRTIVFRAIESDGIITITANDKTEYKRILKTFSRYVSRKVIEKMQDSDRNFFKTERMNITILFADLRGFTSLSSEMAPGDVKDLLNEFLTSAIAVVDRYEGTVDKIIGDEIMVLFGAPVYSKDHAYIAVKAAIEMEQTHQRLLSKWKSEKRPAPPLGIGVNTGDVVVGNIGSSSRMDYTAIGHNVNLASRLCSAAAGGEILLTENTILGLSEYANSHPEQVKEKINFQKAGQMLFKGLQEEISVARVLYDSEGTA